MLAHLVEDVQIVFVACLTLAAKSSRGFGPNKSQQLELICSIGGGIHVEVPRGGYLHNPLTVQFSNLTPHMVHALQDLQTNICGTIAVTGLLYRV